MNHQSNESILSRSSEIGQKVIRDSNHDSDSSKHYEKSDSLTQKRHKTQSHHLLDHSGEEIRFGSSSILFCVKCVPHLLRQDVLVGAELQQAEDQPPPLDQPPQAAREEEDGAGAQVAEGDRRLHRAGQGREGQDPRRAHHPRGLPRRGHGAHRDVLRPLARALRTHTAGILFHRFIDTVMYLD